MPLTTNPDFTAGQVKMKRGDFLTTVCLLLVPGFVKDLCNMYTAFHKTLANISKLLSFN